MLTLKVMENSAIPSKIRRVKGGLSLALLALAPLLAGNVFDGFWCSMLTWVVSSMLVMLMFVDAKIFGISWASITLLAFMYPALVTMYLSPSGELFAFFNSRSGLAEERWPLCVGCMIYFYVVFSWLLYKGNKGFGQFDGPAVTGLKLSRAWSNSLAIASIVFTYVTMPGIPPAFTGAIYLQFAGIDRDSTGVAGAGAALIPLVLCAMCYLAERTLLRSITVVVVPLWCILNFRRVDVFGLLLLYIVCAVNGTSTGRYRTATAKVTRLTVIFAVIFLIGIGSVVNVVRSGEDLTFGAVAGTMLTSALSNDTAQGVAYAAMVCIDEFEKDSRDLSQPWIARDVLPAVLGGTPDGALGRLQLEGFTGGGGYAPFEAYLAGGLIAFIFAPFLLYGFIFGSINVFSRLSGFAGQQVSYVVLMLAVLRWPWYGIRTLSSPLLLLVPIVVVIVNGVSFLRFPFVFPKIHVAMAHRDISK